MASVRRTLFALAPALLLARPALAQGDPARAGEATEAPPPAGADPFNEPLPQTAPAPAAPSSLEARLAERATGAPTAPARVQEFFSLTCGHCAAFHRDVWPEVKAKLVQTGRVRMVWRDFPLDQVGLTAAMVARALPAERYEAFLDVLFRDQQRWAYAREPIEELGRLALLAGLSRATFDAVRNDQAFARGVLESRAAGQREYRIEATPSFVFGTRLASGNLPFERFRALAEGAATG